MADEEKVSIQCIYNRAKRARAKMDIGEVLDFQEAMIIEHTGLAIDAHRELLKAIDPHNSTISEKNVLLQAINTAYQYTLKPLQDIRKEHIKGMLAVAVNEVNSDPATVLTGIEDKLSRLTDWVNRAKQAQLVECEVINEDVETTSPAPTAQAGSGDAVHGGETGDSVEHTNVYGEDIPGVHGTEAENKPDKPAMPDTDSDNGQEESRTILNGRDSAQSPETDD